MDRAELRALAEAHTTALLAFLLGAATVLVLAWSSAGGERAPAVVAAQLTIRLGMAVTLFRLARRLGEPGPAVWAGLSLLHLLVGAIVLAHLNLRARRRLRALGLEVGALGARVSRVPPVPPAPDA